MEQIVFKPNQDIVSFLNAVKTCNGAVELQTPAGDVLNLKSELSRFLLAYVVTKTEFIQGASLVCELKSDAALLKQFLQDV